MIRSILVINSVLETNYISKIESQLKNRCIKGTFALWENVSSLKRMPYEVMRNISNVFVIRRRDKVQFEG